MLVDVMLVICERNRTKSFMMTSSSRFTCAIEMGCKTKRWIRTGHGKHLRLVDVIDLERLENLRLDKVADASLGHHRDGDLWMGQKK